MKMTVIAQKIKIIKLSNGRLSTIVIAVEA